MSSYLLLATLLVAAVHCLDNGEGLMPPLGFNTWNHFYCNINEKVIRQAADAIINLGLKRAGYNYVNIDDCWMGKERNDKGELVPDATRFPHGIKALAEYVHSKGLKLGIYSSAGTKTCQGLPASLGHEVIDAKIWASWGVDYLKYDNCNHDSQSGPVRYAKMRDALNSTGRHIYYSICSWGEEEVWKWANKVGNSWRTTGDIEDKFNSMRTIYQRNAKLYSYAARGGWNDPDMLEVGNGGMPVAAYRTHFALWSMAKSPMLIGCDLTKVPRDSLEILLNKDIIALNQDKVGKQARCILNCADSDFSKDSTHPQFTVVELENSNYAVAVTNWNDNTAFKDMVVSFAALNLPLKSYKVRDLWLHKDMGPVSDTFTVPTVGVHDTAVYKLTKA